MIIYRNKNRQSFKLDLLREVIKPNMFKRLTSYLVAASILLFSCSLSYGQQKIPLTVLANIRDEIKKAPFSKMFVIKSGPVLAYAVKDKDYKASNPSLRVFSLWTDIPSQNRLLVAVQYCLPNKAIAFSNTYLAEMVLMNGKQPLVTINRYIKVRRGHTAVIRPGQYVPSDFDDPFYDPFWSPFGFGFSYSPPTYIPAITCSAGSSRFNLTSVSKELARLPNKTLDMRLIFNNGISQTWQLGEGTVKALKQLPAIRRQVSSRTNVREDVKSIH